MTFSKKKLINKSFKFLGLLATFLITSIISFCILTFLCFMFYNPILIFNFALSLLLVITTGYQIEFNYEYWEFNYNINKNFFIFFGLTSIFVGTFLSYYFSESCFEFVDSYLPSNEHSRI